MTEKDFLPISKEDMQNRGWEQCDFVLVTADAYIRSEERRVGKEC